MWISPFPQRLVHCLLFSSAAHWPTLSSESEGADSIFALVWARIDCLDSPPGAALWACVTLVACLHWASWGGTVYKAVCVCVCVCCVHEDKQDMWSAERYTTLIESGANWRLLLFFMSVCVCVCVSSLNNSLCVQGRSAASRGQSQHLCSSHKKADFRELFVSQKAHNWPFDQTALFYFFKDLLCLWPCKRHPSDPLEGLRADGMLHPPEFWPLRTCLLQV